MHPFSTLADIPVLDWQGPPFLLFYVVAMFVASIWSYHRGSRLSGRFDNDHAPGEIRDPMAAAYLAGGAPRALQSAVCCLFRRGLIDWRKSTFGGRWIAVADAKPEPGLSPLERAVYSAILGSKKGLKAAELGNHATSQLSSIEAGLAGSGLRPTQNERAGHGFRACLPVVIVIGIGVVKLFIGLSRDKPVVLLVVLLFLSLIVALIVGASASKKRGFLTPAGKDLLDRMRETRHKAQTPDSADVSTWAMSIALFGPHADPWIAGQQDLAKELSQLQKSHAASDGGGCGASGCSSGCGSGCGGGCGGCGGD